MNHFLKPKELLFEPLADWEWKSFYQWIRALRTLETRNPFVKSLLDYLETFMTVPQIMEILETLAINAAKTANYYQSEQYYENMLYVYDNIDKLELIREHFTTKKAKIREGSLRVTRRSRVRGLADRVDPQEPRAEEPAAEPEVREDK